MKHTLLLITLLMLIATSALAQIPLTMSFQGQLTDGDGNPVADGPFDLTFRLYDDASDGTMLWEEIHPKVDVLRGLFNVILGSTDPLNLPFDKPYWLGITIRTDAELKPRTALTSSPYSLNLPTAGTTGDGHSLDAVDGDPEDAVFVNAAGNVGIGTKTPGNTLDIKSSNATLRLEDTDSRARITMFNSVATPAADVGVGRINFRGNDDGGNTTNYAQLNGVVTDDSDTSEDGYFTISTMQAGTLTEPVRVDHAGNVGIGRQTAYDLARQGKLPVLRLGRKLLVPKIALERMLSEAGYGT